MSEERLYIMKCDLPGCAATSAQEKMDFFYGKHLCKTHVATIENSNALEQLRQDARWVLSEDHEGGTRHLPAAKAAFDESWDRVITSIKQAEMIRTE